MTLEAHDGVRAEPPEAVAWWQRGAIYQIYPRSFNDSDGDGVGDLRGIEQRLGHIASLGAEAIWLSPIYPSPMADFGYDVADYTGVDQLFGSLEDFDRLVAACHARGLKVVLDWVPSHTSDQHPWFVESRRSRESPKRDWYVWRDGDGDGPPNDWISAFPAIGGAWSFDAPTGQWYLHSFTPQQPDLNWDNPEVEAAMHDVLRFWLERGVDGFRLDAITKFAKDPELRSNAGADRSHDQDWPTVHDRLASIRRLVDAYPDRMLVGEVYLFETARLAAYVGAGQLHMAHNFVAAQLPWEAAAFRRAIEEFDAEARDAWPAWFLGNHDMPRPASRFGPHAARAALLLLYALRGTPFVYQGEELGLPDAVIPPERVVDVDGRDPSRAPVPWTPGPGHGFTGGEPWLPFVDGADELSAERQAADPRSTLSFTRRLAALRAGTRELQDGAQRLLDAAPGVLAWTRGERILAAVNFTGSPAPLPETGRLLLSTDPGRADGAAVLGPNEAVLLLRSGSR
ncbi:alpha-amylase family glycosyl hydrolase [Candidatus Solirubrobacter pratensis]|uniref:alpha-amylase family glycosyl hydrolase n=1 Tax=Candidatus Solirubrobacter pratensis TaxID=1298857 RepID=UPI0004116ED7|nr:alpha-amylase family glycosyl hydrolase [Candidatus Solirubrobacter pratensis]